MRNSTTEEPLLAMQVWEWTATEHAAHARQLRQRRQRRHGRQRAWRYGTAALAAILAVLLALLVVDGAPLDAALGYWAIALRVVQLAVLAILSAHVGRVVRRRWRGSLRRLLLSRPAADVVLLGGLASTTAALEHPAVPPIWRLCVALLAVGALFVQFVRHRRIA